MLLSELLNLVNNDDEWSFLGEGSYNKVYKSKSEHTIKGYTGLWVLKQAKRAHDYLSSAPRSVRLWNLLNPKYPALSVDNGWLAPYLGNQVAVDDEVAEKLIEIYREHRIILADAYVPSNFLKYKGDTVVIDIDYAIRRDSRSRVICIDDQYLYSKLLDNIYKWRFSSPKATSVLHTLLYLDKHALGSVVKNEHITPEMIGLLRLFRIFKKPILPNTLNYLLTYTKTKPLTNIIPEELFRFVDEEYNRVKMAVHHAIHYNDSYTLRRLFAESAQVQTILEDANEEGLTPIELAATNKHWDLVIMIADRYSKDAEDKKQYARVLVLAVRENEMRAVQSLIAAKVLEQDTVCWSVSDTGNTYLHYAVQVSHEPILQVLTQERLITNPLFKAAFFCENKEGLTPFMLALKTNTSAIIPLMSCMQLLDSRTKLNVFLAAGEDLLRVAQSNELVFSALLQHTATMNYSEHERLYNASWLDKELGLYPSIYENRIRCLIHGLLNGPHQLIDVDRKYIVQSMSAMFDDLMRTNKSAIELAFIHNQFAYLLDRLNRQSRRPSGCYQFFCGIQWTEKNQKQLQMVSKLEETIGKLRPSLLSLESALEGAQQSRRHIL